jgi:hypothetical protein
LNRHLDTYVAWLLSICIFCVTLNLKVYTVH